MSISRRDGLLIVPDESQPDVPRPDGVCQGLGPALANNLPGDGGAGFGVGFRGLKSGEGDFAQHAVVRRLLQRAP